jgi:hypothetical protein
MLWHFLLKGLVVPSKRAVTRKLWFCLLLTVQRSRLPVPHHFNLRRRNWPSSFQRAVREGDKCGLGENDRLRLLWVKLTLYFSHQPIIQQRGYNSSAPGSGSPFFVSYFACINFRVPLSRGPRDTLEVLFGSNRT